MLSTKIRKSLDIAARMLIAAAAIGYIVFRISRIPSGQLELTFGRILSGREFSRITIALVMLMLVNISFEALKWQRLMRQAGRVSFFESLQAVLGGMTVSVFTPNRVGEFLGRAFILSGTDAVKTILLTVVGSMSQLMITILMGGLAFLMAKQQYLLHLAGNASWLVDSLAIMLAFGGLLFVFVFFNLSFLHRISFLVPERFSRRLRNAIDTVADIPRAELLLVCLISLLRYAIFSTQFFIALHLLGLPFSVAQAAMAIPLIYLALAAIPSIALTEIGVRGSVAVFVFGLFVSGSSLNDSQALAAISASMLVWFMNIVVPSLLGVLVVFRLKFFRR